VTNICFLQQNYVCGAIHVCHDKTSVMTNICQCKQFCFVVTSILLLRLWQQSASFVMTKVCLSRENFRLNKYFICRNNKICGDKNLVTTSILLSWQKMCFVATELLKLFITHDTCGSQYLLATELRSVLPEQTVHTLWQGKGVLINYYWSSRTSKIFLRLCFCFVWTEFQVCQSLCFVVVAFSAAGMCS